jgi:hypothetical protein
MTEPPQKSYDDLSDEEKAAVVDQVTGTTKDERGRIIDMHTGEVLVPEKSSYDDLSDEEKAAFAEQWRRVNEVFAFANAHENESHTRLGWSVQQFKWRYLRRLQIAFLVTVILFGLLTFVSALTQTPR